MILFEVFLNGLLLGGMYGLIALGLNLQYGVARILNLSYGEFFMGGAFTAFFTDHAVEAQSAARACFISLPIAFAMNWLIYQYLMMPLIRRAPDQDALDADVVLVTFGLLFVFQGLALVNWSGDLRGYSFLSVAGATSLGATVALNRLLAFLGACVLALGAVPRAALHALRRGAAGHHHRSGRGEPGRRRRAASTPRWRSPPAARWPPLSGMLVSTFISFSATTGVEYTLKALIVVIMAGVGRVTGTLAAGLLLGVVESLGGYLIDPGADDRHQFRAVHAGPAAAADGVVHPCLSCRDKTGGPPALLRAGACSRSRCCRLFASGYVISLFICCCSPTSRSRPPGRSSPARRATSRSPPRPSSASASTRWRSCTSTCRCPSRWLAAAVVGFLVAAGRRPLHAAPARRLLRRLHVRPHRAGAPGHQLVGDQDQQDGVALHLHRRVEREHLRDAAGGRAAHHRRQLVREPACGSAMRCAPSARTRRWRATPASTPPASRCCALRISASVMALVGAVLALRYPYIDASIAFNNTWSFQVLIAALLGGPGRPWGPAVGAIPLVLLSEYLAGTFPHHFGIALGLCFVVIVYFLPGGIAPLVERAYRCWRRALPAAAQRQPAGQPAGCMGASAWRAERQSCSASAACARRSAAWSPCAISPSTSAAAASPA